MPLRIGIPRALLAYYYLPLWETFFVQLGAEVLVSPKSNKELLDCGVELAVDEVCLPVKVFMGHVNYLKSRVDVLFIPRVVSVEQKKYTCPKLLGLPDMVRSNIPDLPVIWHDTVNLSAGIWRILPVVYEVGRRITTNIFKVSQAFWQAYRQLRHYEHLLRQAYMAEEAYEMLRLGRYMPGQLPAGSGMQPGNNLSDGSAITIAVVGHAYNIYDTFISMRIIPRLRDMGIRVVTPEMLRKEEISRAVSHMSKDLFWTFCKRIMGTACHCCQQAVDGIINIAAFGCGPDSLVGEMLARETRRRGHMPFMLLTIDEHTGEAGLLTRIEAFVDMIRWRKQKNACNLSPNGDLGSDISYFV